MGNNFENAIRLADKYSRIYLHRYTFNRTLDQYNISRSLDSLAREVIDEIDSVDFFPFRDENVLGFTFKDKLGTSIAINDCINFDKHDVRLGFTLGHEIGHVVLQHPISQSFVISNNLYDGKEKFEQEANTFSANLLLPFRVMCYQLMKGFHIRQISAVSGVSKEVIENRIRSTLKRRFGIENNEVDRIVNEYKSCYKPKQVLNTILVKILKKYTEYFFENYESHQYTQFVHEANALAFDIMSKTPINQNPTFMPIIRTIDVI